MRYAKLLGALAAVALIAVLGLRTAHRGPFAPEPWRNIDGRVAGTGDQLIKGAPQQSQGSPHCGWQYATFISFNGGLYIADPTGKLIGQRNSAESKQPPISYDTSASLPADAIDTGWYRGDVHLWVSPGESGTRGHNSNIYLRYPDHVERLPAFGKGCA